MVNYGGAPWIPFHVSESAGTCLGSLTLIAVFIMGTPVALALARAFASDSAED